MGTASNKERIIQELVHGQECATQLRILFDNPCEETGHLSAEELVQNILRSFDQTISALTSSIDSADQVSQNQATDCNDDEGSSESRKRPGSQDKRGCYKRKRGVQTRKIVSASMEYGNAWRKYGQKNILNSKYPRGYFRCTHKHEQGCRALKQVQRMEDDPQMYEITYIGTHTCIDSFSRAPQMYEITYIGTHNCIDSFSRAPQMITPEYSESWESNHMGNQIPNPSAVKKEHKEETIEATDCTDLDSMVWKEIMGSDYGFLSNNNMGVGYENGFHFD